MALSPKFAVAELNKCLDAIKADYDNGYLRIYSGAQPATPETALSGQVLLAELRFGATAFPAAAGGVLTANAITADASADASGTAAWYRALKADGTSALNDGSVGVTPAQFDMVINSTSINLGANVSCSSFTMTLPAA
jgi:hypothetical protein